MTAGVHVRGFGLGQGRCCCWCAVAGTAAIGDETGVRADCGRCERRASLGPGLPARQGERDGWRRVCDRGREENFAGHVHGGNDRVASSRGRPKSVAGVSREEIGGATAVSEVDALPALRGAEACFVPAGSFIEIGAHVLQ